jgi:hypothetical protein
VEFEVEIKGATKRVVNADYAAIDKGLLEFKRAGNVVATFQWALVHGYWIKDEVK